jgi:superfamily I DNA and RNA helicase
MQVVFGTKRNPLAADALIHALQPFNLTGTLYIGYPIVAAADEHVFVDALLTCGEHGLVAFDLEPVRTTNVAQRQDNLYAALLQRLIAFRPLRSGRELAFVINVVTFAPSPSDESIDPPVVSGLTVGSYLKERCLPVPAEILKAIDSAIQRVTSIKPQRRRANVQRADSKGAVLKQIETEIATLDQWQKIAAIEMPEGLQRIRGLAGSGKTIVLALKAAYLHTQHPDWAIAVTFNTRSLYQQFTDLITRFTFEHIGDKPDWDRLKILHAWGAARRIGLYSEIAVTNGVEPVAFNESKQRFGSQLAFRGVCSELLDKLKHSKPIEMYDAVLIDEAQDLPQAFFELIYLSTKSPKRIVWAYDELQNLGAYAMAPPQELFGVDSHGHPRVGDLRNSINAARQDVVLPVCYRNTPWALTVAHALGFGLHRQRGLVQFFDEPQLLLEVGYEVTNGALSPGQHVELKRSPSSAPEYFERLLDKQNVVKGYRFESDAAQAGWVAEQVARNLEEDELEHRDILIVVADPIHAQRQAGPIMKALSERNIASHLAGVTSSVDELFSEDSVAISGIYRAKGHEAAAVYVVNCEYADSPLEAQKRRNILFTAITRSRAWVTLCGVGVGMVPIGTEVRTVIDNDFNLSFRVPTEDELQRIRRIHKDRSKQEYAEAERVTTSLRQAIEMFKRGDLDIENLPEDLRKELRELKKVIGDQ